MTPPSHTKTRISSANNSGPSPIKAGYFAQTAAAAMVKNVAALKGAAKREITKEVKRPFKSAAKPAIMLSVSLLLASCATQTANSVIAVDRNSLLKSVIYTQRKLVSDAAINGNIGTEPSTQALLLSYCDLIKRKAVKSADIKRCQTPLSATASQCSARFHLCLRPYKTLNQDAPACEQQLHRCLQNDTQLTNTPDSKITALNSKPAIRF